jgi:hypothetical protein
MVKRRLKIYITHFNKNQDFKLGSKELFGLLSILYNKYINHKFIKI